MPYKPVQSLMGITPVADILRLGRRNPGFLNETEGARPYYGGAEAPYSARSNSRGGSGVPIQKSRYTIGYSGITNKYSVWDADAAERIGFYNTEAEAQQVLKDLYAKMGFNYRMPSERK